MHSLNIHITTQPSCGISCSLFSIPKLHHQIAFVRFNLKLHYPPSYEREIWHYVKANTDHIQRAINSFPWERGFPHADRNQKVYLKDVFSNCIQLETTVREDKDTS